MKRMIVALSTVFLVSLGGIAVASAAVGPEVDEADATISMPTTAFTPVACPGEDGINYVTYNGSWKGTETDTNVGGTDYNLSGTLTVKKIVWTINLTTDRGLLTGAIELKSSTVAGGTATETYAGTLTLITQGLPGSSSPNGVPARGWIDAATYTNKVTDGGSLLANVEMNIIPGFGATGSFGNYAPVNQDWSVAWNGQVC